MFTGLPRAWRDLPAGHFDADGKPPAIDDERVSWHIGDTHETLPRLGLAEHRDSQWLVLFDLDLYEPTLAAWNLLQPFLEPGDLLYFDEAIDSDERRVLNEQVLAETAVSPIGTTTNSLGLKVSGN